MAADRATSASLPVDDDLLDVVHGEHGVEAARSGTFDIVVDARAVEDRELRQAARQHGARYDRRLGARIRETSTTQQGLSQLRMALQAGRRVCLVIDVHVDVAPHARTLPAPALRPPRPSRSTRLARIVEGEWYCPDCTSSDVELVHRDHAGKHLACAACNVSFDSPEGQCIWCGSTDTFDEETPAATAPGRAHRHVLRTQKRRRCNECGI